MESEDDLIELFGIDGLNKIKSNPVVSPLISDPGFCDMIKDIRDNPGSILKYQTKLSNPLALMTILPLIINKEEKEQNDNKNKAEKIKNEGNSLFSHGKYEDALKKYDEAIALDPENVIYKTNKCTTLINLKDYKGAIRAALSAVSSGKRTFAPNDQMWKAYMKLGTSYKLSGEYQQALNSFEAAYRIKKEKITKDSIDQMQKLIK